MSDGAYAKVGAKLVERGYAAIPIMPGTKRPGKMVRGEWAGMNNWRDEYTRRLPTKWEIQIWSGSDAGVCVVCGPASKNLIGVDIDTDDAAIRSAILGVLPPSTVIKRGKKGETHFFRGPTVKESKSWNLPLPDGKKFRVCDLIGPGRQTLLPPTIHPETELPYEWVAGSEALENVDVGELAELTPEHVAAIGDALAPHGYEPEAEQFEAVRGRYEGGDAEKPIHRQLNDAAMANLEAWVPGLGLYGLRRTPQGLEAVATWRASNTGQTVEKRKHNLKIARNGIVDFGDGPRNYTPLNLVIAALDLGNDVDRAFSWLSDALGWNDAPVIDLPLKAPSRPAAVAAAPVEMPVAAYGLPVVEVKGDSEVSEETDAELPAPVKPDPLESYTRCPGLIGGIVDWIEATARRPNRVMALGVAVTVIGTLIGRRIAGPTRSATHLYVACLAPTGSGKQHPLDCLALLLRSAKADHLVGPSEFISMPAVINMLARQPLCLSAQDEFGSFLKRINNRRASGFEQGISKIMRMVWGVSFGEYMTPEWAGKSALPIFAPALSIFGMSTPDEFYRGLQGSELENGFLNRFILLKAGRTDARVPAIEPGKVPEAISLALGELFRWGADENSLATARVSDPNLRPTPHVIRWSDNTAQTCYADLEKHVENLIEKDEETKYYLGRTAEIAIRLATIRAVGRWGPYGDGPTVDRSDVEWGRDIAMQCGLALAKEAKLYMAENERQAWSNRILEVIRRRGTATPRAIQQNIRGAMKMAEIKDILEQLVESGAIEAQRGNLTGGRLGVTGYKYIGE